MYSFKVYSPYRSITQQKLPNDFFHDCYKGNIKQAKKEIDNNVNIYQTFSERNITPILLAIHSNNEKLVNFLLDIYQRDLEALKGTNFKRALIVSETDLSEEFYGCCVKEFSSEDQVEPVLLKTNNQNPPKLFFLRKYLKEKDDSCLQLIKSLQDKNGLCDINWRFSWNHDGKNTDYGDTYIYLAAYFGMTNVLEKLLANKNVDKVIDGSELTPLHYSISRGKLKATEILMRYYEISKDDTSYLQHAAKSGNSEMFELVANNMMTTCGWSLKEIFNLRFNIHDDVSGLLHFIALSQNYNYFLNHTLLIDSEEMLAQNGNGDTILHILAREFQLENFSQLFLDISRKYPKLLTIENCNNHLPLYLLASNIYEDEALFREMYDMTSKETGSEDKDTERTLKLLEKLIEQTNLTCFRSILELTNFDFVEKHGNRLLQYSIVNCRSHNNCFEYLLNHPSRINLNMFYEGSNVFLSAVAGANFYFTDNQAEYMIEMLTRNFKIEDVNACDALGNSILMYVVAFANMDLIQYFIHLQADCNMINDEGSTLLHFGVKNLKNDEVVMFLIDRGVDCQVINNKGVKAIETCARYSNEVAFRILLAYETDDELNRKYGEQKETLLHISAQTSRTCNLELLLDRKIDFNAIDGNGNLFIHKLLERREAFVFTILEKMQSKKIPINVNAKNSEGISFIYLAAEICKETVLGFLFKNFFDQIDFTSINNKQQTFTHGMFWHREIVHWEKLLEVFPALVAIMNEQMEKCDIDGLTPLNYLIPSLLSSCFVRECPETMNFLIKFLDLENFQHQFNLFTKDIAMIEMIVGKFPNFFENFNELEKFLLPMIGSTNNAEIFNFTLRHVSMKNLLTRWKGAENILHLVSERNDTSKIDFLLKHLNYNQLSILSHQLNGSGNVAKDLLNEENKAIFGNCF